MRCDVSKCFTRQNHEFQEIFFSRVLSLSLFLTKIFQQEFHWFFQDKKKQRNKHLKEKIVLSRIISVSWRIASTEIPRMFLEIKTTVTNSSAKLFLYISIQCIFCGRQEYISQFIVDDSAVYERDYLMNIMTHVHHQSDKTRDRILL